MDIWERLYEAARVLYHPEEITPFFEARHVVCALEAENGEYFTGFNVEACCGVMNLCAERVAALNMLQSGQTVVKRLIAFRDAPPRDGGSGIPCGACRELLLQLSPKNADTLILVDYDSRTAVTLRELMPDWWGWYRYQEKD